MKKILTTLSVSTLAVASSGAAVIWNAGKADDAQEWNWNNRAGSGFVGGENVINIREFGGNAPGLPGSATNMGSADGDAVRDVDNDYYFAGVYTTQVDGGPAYTPLGTVAANEQVMERAWVGADNDMRFHFNFPASVTATDLITITFGITDGFDQPDAVGWNIDVGINGQSQMIQNVVNGDQNGDWTTPAFTLGDIGATAGPGPDNYVSLRGTNTGSSSRWLSLDYVEVDVSPIPEPSSAGLLGLAAAGLLLVRRRR